MKISVIGTGYVGLVTGACLASQGFFVICCDTDYEKIRQLQKGIIPFYEPGLQELVNSCIYDKKTLRFTEDITEGISYADILIVTVNTPTLENNFCNLENIFEVAGKIAHNMTGYKLIIHKSTVPVGTGHKVKSMISGILNNAGKDIKFDVVSNPEFLREGSAINDFMKPDRIIIGTENTHASELVKDLYAMQIGFGIPLLITDIQTAEMIKYASNSFLAAKISFVNEIANICEYCGADGIIVAKGMGLDKRIGDQFLEPGPGFGGSCFPKDVKALYGITASLGYDAKLIKSIIETNALQKARMFDKIKAAAYPLENKTITILGLSFKPGTDDIREAPSVYIIKELLSNGALVRVYDPEAMDNMRTQSSQYFITYCKDAYDACKSSDCIVLMTAWKELSSLDFGYISSIVNTPVFLDLRNVYEPAYVKSYGFTYQGVGRQ